jgi:hypothetical protein
VSRWKIYRSGRSSIWWRRSYRSAEARRQPGNVLCTVPSCREPVREIFFRPFGALIWWPTSRAFACRCFAAQSTLFGFDVAGRWARTRARAEAMGYPMRQKVSTHKGRVGIGLVGKQGLQSHSAAESADLGMQEVAQNVHSQELDTCARNVDNGGKIG